MSDKKFIEIGQTATGERVELDLYKFIQTRAMIQASSGGGKSWLARVIEEQTMHAGIPVWTIDPEGEYTTLREKFEVVIFGSSDESDLPADEKTLRLTLPDLFNASVSVVFDLSESSLEEKQAVTALVCTFLLSVPKPDQKPILLVVDEAQALAPEREITASGKALSDVASRGRKRALGLLVATQRLSALNKNLTTQLQNRFVGFCREDVEVQRAAELVGKKNSQELPDFEAGDFFAVGGAVNFRHAVKFHSALVETTHPDASIVDFGRSGKTTVASEGLSELIKALQTKLAEAAAAFEPEETGRSYSRQDIEEVKELEYRLQEKQRDLTEWERDLTERETAVLAKEKILETYKPHIFRKIGDLFLEARELLSTRLGNLENEFDRLLTVPGSILPPVETVETAAENLQPEPSTVQENAPVVQKNEAPVVQKTTPKLQTTGNPNLPPAQQKILGSLRVFETLGLASAHRANVAALAGYSHSSGSFGSHLAELKSHGFIEYAAGSHLRLSEKARELPALFPIPEINSNEQLHAAWFRILNSAETSILKVLIEFYPRTVSRELIGHNTGYSPTSGSFGAHLAHLKSLGLIEYGNSGEGIRGARATSLLFPLSAKGGKRN
ncbi:MAG: DUF87 domain-containing protein [Acidobacteriota bacterium]|nr:DUF87 domain-containing protein [Acidobacteriota bacterium]